MTSPDTPRGRHRLATVKTRSDDSGRHAADRSPRPVRRPTLAPRSATVIAVTVGAVLSLGLPDRVQLPAPRPHPDAPGPALEPVIPAPREGRSAEFEPVPAGVTGQAIAGAHASGSASVRALDAAAALQPPHAVAPERLFAA